MKLYLHLTCAQKCQKCKFVPRLLSMIVVLELIEAGARVYIKKETKKKSNDTCNLQQNYKRHK